MKISAIKIDGIIHAIGEHSQDELKHMVSGKEYVIDIKMNRNPVFHRKAFSLFKMLFDNQEDYDNFDIYRKMICMQAGRFITVVLTDGKTVLWPESIAFEKMSQDEFEKLFQEVITWSVKKYGYAEEMLWNILNYA